MAKKNKAIVVDTKNHQKNTQVKKQSKLISKKNNTKIKNKNKPIKKRITSNSSSDTDSDSESLQNLTILLSTYTKPFLIDLLSTLATTNLTLSSKIIKTAENDTSHRKIFVHGLGWDADKNTLKSAFKGFGEIDDCNVIKDKKTGRSKGYGFVLFASRKGAEKALKEPNKKIGGRVASCQLSSVGPPASGTSATAQQDGKMGCKIYVSNVPTDADPEKLRAVFAKFGQIEVGPLGFDTQTGKSRGFALFVYKTAESAKMAIQEQFKVFDGHQLRCQMAIDNKNKATSLSGAATITTAVQPMQQPVMAAMSAAQNMAMMSQQYPGFNPLYSGMLTNPIMGAQGYVGSGQLGGYGATGTSQLGAYGAPGSGQFGGYGATTDLGQLSGYGATGPSQLSAYGATGPSQLSAYGATGPSQLSAYGATGSSQLGGYSAPDSGLPSGYRATGMSQLGGQGSTGPSQVNKIGGGLVSSMLGSFSAPVRTLGAASGSYSGLTNPLFKR